MKLENKTDAALIRTTLSLPDGLTLSSSAPNLKDRHDNITHDNITNDHQASSPNICRGSPPVPCLKLGSIFPNHSASPSESGSVPVHFNLSELSEPEEIRSPAVSEAEEVSSSSGSYSVTSVTTDISKSELCEPLRISNNN